MAVVIKNRNRDFIFNFRCRQFSLLMNDAYRYFKKTGKNMGFWSVSFWVNLNITSVE